MVELLVTLGVTGVVLGGVVQFFTQHAHAMRTHSFRISG